MHLDEELVQRLLHGELDPSAETSLRSHVATCAECRSRVDQAEREESRVFELLRGVDHPPPRVDVATIAARARGRGLRWGRRVAGIAVALAVAGAAYAAPGSPLPAFVGRVAARISPAPQRSAPVAAPVRSDVAAGIAVAAGDRFTIVFSANQSNGMATVSLTDGRDVAVRALGGAASFTSDVDRLSIGNEGSSARFEIEIPREAARVEVRVGARTVFLKEGDRVRAHGRRDAGGRYLVPLSAPPTAASP